MSSPPCGPHAEEDGGDPVTRTAEQAKGRATASPG